VVDIVFKGKRFESMIIVEILQQNQRMKPIITNRTFFTFIIEPRINNQHEVHDEDHAKLDKSWVWKTTSLKRLLE